MPGKSGMSQTDIGNILVRKWAGHAQNSSRLRIYFLFYSLWRAAATAESARPERTSVNTSGDQVSLISLWFILAHISGVSEYQHTVLYEKRNFYCKSVLCSSPLLSFSQSLEALRSSAMRNWTQRAQRRATVEGTETNGSSVVNSEF